MTDIPTSDDLLNTAKQALAAGAKNGEVVDARFRRLAPGSDQPLHIDVEVLVENETSILRRVLISQASNNGPVRIAEYEETTNLQIGVPARPKITKQPDLAIEEGVQKEKSTAEIRRAQIFKGACEVIAKKGYGNASVREIAKASGLSVPSLYQYVASKEDILFMITEECMREIFDAFDRTVGGALKADEKMEQAIGDYISYISKNRRYINLVYSETRSLPQDYRDRIFDLERKLMREWEVIFQDGVKGGLFRAMDPSLTANIVYFACSVWALRYWAIGEFSEEEVRSTLINLLMHGLRA